MTPVAVLYSFGLLEKSAAKTHISLTFAIWPASAELHALPLSFVVLLKPLLAFPILLRNILTLRGKLR